MSNNKEKGLSEYITKGKNKPTLCGGERIKGTLSKKGKKSLEDRTDAITKEIFGNRKPNQE
jgi:hypothetical protein